MDSRRRLFDSSIGTKLLIGATGLALFLYLLIHIAGNLVIFAGPAAYNKYAFTLESNPLLPIIELLLLAVFVVHIYKAVRMYVANRGARPVKYVKKEYAGPPSRKTLASSTMILSGLWLLAFLVIHVKAFREGWGTEYPWPQGGRDLYRQEFAIFRSPALVGFYVLSMLMIGSHLWHGAASSLQSLGLDHPTWTPRLLKAGRVAAVLIAGGFIGIVLWVHFTGGAR